LKTSTTRDDGQDALAWSHFIRSNIPATVSSSTRDRNSSRASGKEPSTSRIMCNRAGSSYPANHHQAYPIRFPEVVPCRFERSSSTGETDSALHPGSSTHNTLPSTVLLLPGGYCQVDASINYPGYWRSIFHDLLVTIARRADAPEFTLASCFSIRQFL